MDAERRRCSVTLLHVLALLLFALAPRIPSARHLLGALSVEEALVFTSPAALSIVVTKVVYRRVGVSQRRPEVGVSVTNQVENLAA